MQQYKLLRQKMKKVSRLFVTLVRIWLDMRLSNCSLKQMVIGPVIEGFYYDIFSPKPFTLEDMAAIEERMKNSSIRIMMS
jgi:threonyl-tRNA synthetase